MANGSISRRYAKAFIRLGQETDKTESFSADLNTFLAVLDVGEGELRNALTNPGLSGIERKAVVDAVLARLSLEKDSANFFRLLVDKNRFDEFDHIHRAFNEMADEAAGRARATVSTAAKMGADMKKSVKEALEASTGKTVEIEFIEDPSIIGGMVAQVGDISYDASVRARLEELQSALIRNPGAVANA
jgi:F-type H+-transporting ATPase subunit delta